MRGDRPSSSLRLIALSRFTPHARGSTGWVFPGDVPPCVYPACAGIDLLPRQVQDSYLSLPRMRGDRPDLALVAGGGYKFTPHARGSTHTSPHSCLPKIVYPACAGIDPGYYYSRPLCLRLPRMRGDRPRNYRKSLCSNVFTPHARGSTWVLVLSLDCDGVYPACAGIDLASGYVRWS